MWLIIQDYEFSWSRMLQSEGDTGPLLMYTYARCCSIESNAHSLEACDVNTCTLGCVM